MSELETYYTNLRNAISGFIVPVQTAKVINREKYEELVDSLMMISHELEGIDAISKSFISEIYFTIKIVRIEAEYFEEKDRSDLSCMADKLELIFDLILKDDTLRNRHSNKKRE